MLSPQLLLLGLLQMRYHCYSTRSSLWEGGDAIQNLSQLHGVDAMQTARFPLGPRRFPCKCRIKGAVRAGCTLHEVPRHNHPH